MRRFLRKLSAAVCCLVLVTLLAGWIYISPGRGPREYVNPHADAYLEIVDGAKVLHVKGSPYEMGYQQGALLRGEGTNGIAKFAQLLELGKRETGIPVFVFNLVLDLVYRRCSPHILDRYKREMEGLADGLGIDVKVVRRMHVVSVVTERGCSCFSVFGKATSDGTLYHGRNFDWIIEAGLQECGGVTLYEPEGLIPFASAGYLGLAGVLSGMNMEGIATGQIGAINKDGRFSGVPLMFMLRRLLEESHDLDDAGRIIANATRTVGYNYVVADGDALEARVFETTAKHCAVFRDNDPAETAEYAIPIENAVFRSDEAMDPVVRGLQKCANGPALPYGSESYDHRYKGMAADIMASYGAIDERAARGILKNAAMRGMNLHGVLCNATSRIMWVAHASSTEDAWQREYIRYDLKKLFGFAE